LKEKTRILDKEAIDRTLERIEHEILEKSRATEEIAIIGIKNRGAYLGMRLARSIEIARNTGMPVAETCLGLHDLYNADECFLTGTAAELIPVIEIDGRAIGDGKPGPKTLDLLRRFREFIAKA